MKDLVRFTASFASCAPMNKFLCQQLRSRPDLLEVVALKNKYSSPNPQGYRDVNVTLRVRLGESGRYHVCELQVNLEDMLVAWRVVGILREISWVLKILCRIWWNL